MLKASGDYFHEINSLCVQYMYKYRCESSRYITHAKEAVNELPSFADTLAFNSSKSIVSLRDHAPSYK